MEYKGKVFAFIGRNRVCLFDCEFTEKEAPLHQCSQEELRVFYSTIATILSLSLLLLPCYMGAREGWMILQSPGEKTAGLFPTAKLNCYPAILDLPVWTLLSHRSSLSCFYDNCSKLQNIADLIICVPCTKTTEINPLQGCQLSRLSAVVCFFLCAV